LAGQSSEERLETVGQNFQSAKWVRRCEWIIERSTVFILVFTPLAFGAVETWAWSILTLASLLVAGAELFRRRLLRGLDHPFHSWGKLPACFYFYFGFGMLFLLGAVIQIIPLPVSVIGLIRPDQTLAGRAAVLTACPSGRSWATVSLYPSRSIPELIKLAAYILFFLTLVNYRPASGSRRAFVTRLLTAVVVTGFAVSVIGILQKYSWQNRIYWLRPIRWVAHPFGPFVNRNHFAGYIIMVIPLALGMLLSRRSRRPRVPGMNLRDRLLGSDPRRFLLAFMSFVMVVALFLSLSRGGIAAGLLSTVFFLFLAIRFRLLSRRQAFIISGGTLILLALALAYFGVKPLVERFESILTGEREGHDRLTIWRDTIRIHRDFPVLGIGWGCFEKVHPHYKTLRTRDLFTHAENDYLQTAAEMGTWGFITLIGFFLSFFWIVLSWKPPRPRGASVTSSRGRPGGWNISGRSLVAACSAGVLGVALQSAVNFNFSIPANALLLVVLSALAVGMIGLES
jgi:O-antigen ligase